MVLHFSWLAVIGYISISLSIFHPCLCFCPDYLLSESKEAENNVSYFPSAAHRIGSCYHQITLTIWQNVNKWLLNMCIFIVIFMLGQKSGHCVWPSSEFMFFTRKTNLGQKGLEAE